MTTSIAQDLIHIVGKASEAVGAYGQARQAPERIHAAAHSRLSLELVRQEMTRFLWHLYEREGDYWLHIMPDGQIPSGVWTPWGGKSRLNKAQRDILRAWVVGQRADRQAPGPLYFDVPRNRWYVDLIRFPDREDSLAWWKRTAPSEKDWLNLELTYRQRRRDAPKKAK